MSYLIFNKTINKLNNFRLSNNLITEIMIFYYCLLIDLRITKIIIIINSLISINKYLMR